MEINQQSFYTIGIWAFLIIGVANFANYLLLWPINNIFSKISGAAGIIFNFALVFFFNYLRGSIPVEEKIAESEDIDEIIKEIEKKGNNTIMKKVRAGRKIK